MTEPALNPSAYAELHAHSYFSLLDGASAPEALVLRAADLKYPALAITDHDAIYGAVRLSKAAQEARIKPIFGAELTLDDGAHLTLLVKDDSGWRNLCALISIGRANAPKGAACLPLTALTGRTAGLIALSGCPQHGRIPTLLQAGNWAAARVALHSYLDLFAPGDFWIELQHHLLPRTPLLHGKLTALALQAGVGVVATNNVHYAHRAEHRLQDILVCIRHGATIDHSTHIRRANSEYYLKSAAQMTGLFKDHPEALSNTLQVAERCNFTLKSSLQSLPVYALPDGHTAASYLRALCDEGAARRFGEVSGRIRDTLDHELGLITRAGLANYFLIVWDIVRFARENQILCQGRGSAANSLVAYLLNISPVNPLEHDLVFERFLSEERPTAPDIDIDFQADRREEVIQYCYTRYGLDHAAMACTLITFRHKSAIREVGKAIGLPPDIIDQQARQIHARHAGTLAGITANSAAEAGPNGEYSTLTPAQSNIWAQAQALAEQIVGLPRHLGIHNGGMIITAEPIMDRVATEPATMADRSVTQWDKESLEDAGLIKIDILGLRMLSAIAEAIRIAGAAQAEDPAQGERIDLDSLRMDDAAVYRLICEADTIGVFQVESRAQAQVLPRLRPRMFNDLIVAISLIRPGPVQGNMVHPYLRRRFGEEPVQYLAPQMEPALAETLGVILFQEQVLKVARDVGGFTPGEGELLRRALGKSDSAKVARLKGRFIEGALKQGISAATAETIFAQVAAFGGYSFPKSHAAAFAVLVYQSAWLKVYHPAAFYTALLNNQPMGFWSPAVIIGDARRHGYQIASVDIHRSETKCTIEDNGKTIRLGLTYVNGLGQRADAIVAARQRFPFTDLPDFYQRMGLPHRLIERLIRIGAFDSWRIPRRDLLWQLGDLPQHPDAMLLDAPTPTFQLPVLTSAERLAAEYDILGLNTGDHVMKHYRADLRARGILGSADLPKAKEGTTAQTAGLIVVHQSPPTAKGHHFITLEDEDGMMNVIFRPIIYERYREAILHAPILLVTATIQKRGAVVNLIALAARPL
jgi:error-prone DNA polymerase